MIANLIPYPKMKNSGVEWLGDVPEHWEVLPNFAVLLTGGEPNAKSSRRTNAFSDDQKGRHPAASTFG